MLTYMLSETNQTQVVGNWNSSYWCVSNSLQPSECSCTFWQYLERTMSLFCRQFLKNHYSACPALVWDSLLGSSASSDPGALDNNCTSYHIIHSPVVLEEQKCDEGREKEGNRKVLVQGSDSWSVEGDRDSDWNTSKTDTGSQLCYEAAER